MSDLSPAARVQHLRESLDRTSALLAAQPDPIRQSYLRAGTTIAQALIADTHWFTLTLPGRYLQDGLVVEAPRSLMLLRAGGVLARLRRRSVCEHLVANLQKLAGSKQAPAAYSTQLTSYAVAQLLMREADSGDRALVDLPTMTIPRSDAAIAQAKQVVGQLEHFVRWMRWAEALFPGWGSDDTFNEIYARITARLVSVGRLLARWQTENLIDDLQARYAARQFLNGLTVFVPYLDERAYEMAEYRLEVVPSARIPFYPEFLVGACRLAERDVRADNRFSQATRWQLLSLFDLLLHTFDSPVDLS